MTLSEQAARRASEREARWAREDAAMGRGHDDETSVLGDLFYFGTIISAINLAIRGLLNLTD